jgi:hypothetical protein
MNIPSASAKAVDPAFSKVQFDTSECPTCGQDIPSDRVEEISGKVAAREREQTLALSLKFEKQYASDKALAEARAKAELEAERQQSALREAGARDEAQRATTEALSAKDAESERTRLEFQTKLEQQQQITATASNALEAVQRDAAEREKQITSDAKRAAETAAEERIAANDEARRVSDAALRSQLEEADTNRIAAELRGSTLVAQLEELKQSTQAAVSKVREEASLELSRVRQTVADEAEIKFRETLKTYASTAAEAKQKVEEVEARMSELTEQQAATLETSLKTQREALEKSKEEALNIEKSKAFEENQRLATKVSDLQRALENKTAEELGEGAELDLFEALKAGFPEDRISRVPKGTPGGDTIHVVMQRGRECGTIIYDSKNHNQFRNDHVTKLRADQLALKAEHSVLVTRKFPQGARQLHMQDGVLLANPARVVLLATILRQHLLNVHTLGLSQVERESKTAALYEFITSERCKTKLSRIDERAESLLEEQAKEIRWHQNTWKRQGEAIRAIQKAKADLENEIDSIIDAADGGEMSKAS